MCAESDDEMKEWINKIVNITFSCTPAIFISHSVDSATPDTLSPDRSRTSTSTLESVVTFFNNNPTANNNNTSSNDKPRVQKSESSLTLAEMMAIPQSLVSIVAYLDVNRTIFKIVKLTCRTQRV